MKRRRSEDEEGRGGERDERGLTFLLMEETRWWFARIGRGCREGVLGLKGLDLEGEEEVEVVGDLRGKKTKQGRAESERPTFFDSSLFPPSQKHICRTRDLPSSFLATSPPNLQSTPTFRSPLDDDFLLFFLLLPVDDDLRLCL